MRLIFGVLFFLISVRSHSQQSIVSAGDDKFPEYLNIRVGLADPTGDFGDKSNNINAGLAENGINFEIAYQKCLGRNFSWLFMGRISSNKMDKTILDANLKNQLPSNVNFTSSVGNWNTTNFMTGLSFDILLKEDQISLRPRFLFGYSISSSPNLNISVSDQSTQVNTIQEKGSARGLGVVTGADLVIKSSSMTSFTFGLQYFYTKADFDEVEIRTTNNTGSSQLHITSFNQPIGIIGLELGIQFRL